MYTNMYNRAFEGQTLQYRLFDSQFTLHLPDGIYTVASLNLQVRLNPPKLNPKPETPNPEPYTQSIYAQSSAPNLQCSFSLSNQILNPNP